MKTKNRFFYLLILIFLLPACSSPPKIALKAETKQSIKNIAIVELQDPDKYFMNPGLSPAYAGLYAFGALGGLIVGGIQANSIDSATTRFNSAVSPLKPDLNAIVRSQLEGGLKAKGYQVRYVEQPSKTPDGKELDVSKIEGNHDAVLMMKLTAGYWSVDGSVTPHLSLNGQLFTKDGKEKIYAESYVYSAKKFEKLIQIDADPKFVFKSIDAIYDNTLLVVDALRTGAEKLSNRLVSDL